MSRLSSQPGWELPISEVSALAVRKLPSGAREVVAVSDDEFDVVTVTLSDEDAPIETVQHQLPADITAAAQGSEFEGVGL